MNPAMPDDVEIGYSNSRMLPLVALAATMTLINAFDWFGDSRTHALVGCAGLGFIGIATCGLISRLSAANDPALLIGGYGISLLRVANEFRLWGLITGVFVCNYRRRHLVALKMTPALCADRERNGGAPSQWIAWCA
jgi:hypothetical protein